MMAHGLACEDAHPIQPGAPSGAATTIVGLDAIAATIGQWAGRIDNVCLGAGERLGEAIPRLAALSERYTGLAGALLGDDNLRAMRALQAISDEIAAMPDAMRVENRSLVSLAALIADLARQIETLDTSVRFLVAIVANVKIELAGINDDNLRLGGFVDNLQALAGSSRKVLDVVQSVHGQLTERLHLAMRAQTVFELKHRVSLSSAGEEVRASVEALMLRRAQIARTADEIASLTSGVAAKVSRSVVALQIGDNIRQRLEHVAEALHLARRIADGEPPESLADAEPQRVANCLTQIVRIQTDQLEAAMQELPAEISLIDTSLRDVVASLGALPDRGRELGSDDQRGDFLAVLATKLGMARELLEASRHSRGLVDQIAEAITQDVEKLERLSQDLATLAMETTINGTNAVIISYRLGQRGVALSFIARDLRDRALHLAGEVKATERVLDDVLNLGRRFTAERSGQQACVLGAMSDRMDEALEAFRRADQSVADENAKLGTDVTSIDALLRQALDAFVPLEALESSLKPTFGRLSERADAMGGLEDPIEPTLGELLRRRYTMRAERSIFDAYVDGAGEADEAGGGFEAF